MKKQRVLLLLCSLLMTQNLFAENHAVESTSPAASSGRPTVKVGPNEIAEASNELGLALFKEVAAGTSQDQNVLISPISAYLALAMVYNGADGKTREEMEKAMVLNGISRDDFNRALRQLNRLVTSKDESTQLVIANSLWIRNYSSTDPEFVYQITKNFKAHVARLDADDEATINKWASDATKGKIPNVIKKIPDPTKMLVINATYFKAPWMYPFFRDEPAKFHSEGGSKKGPTMFKQDSLQTVQTPEYTAVDLPYNSNSVSLSVVMPKQSLEAFEKGLSYEQLARILKQLDESKDAETLLTMPKFKYVTKMSLSRPLDSAGMKQAFTDNANFSGIGKSLKLDDVTQKTYIDVNEEGTETIAVPTGRLGSTIIPPPPEKTIQIDRPFVYVIRDKDSGAVLFLGSVRQPAAK